ncbi:MAG: AmmeMemoRadiSam system radical SAM enzyme [Nitrososphaerota archaeon]|jgi:pyruvate formate lyase activating enzyme|nr:AmmeMemoRadiSam system radical SAM enzyme [Nitrososphaerota archaeon]
MSLHEAMLYTRQGNGNIKCCLCARRCLISVGAPGFCLVRKNENGTLYSLNYGKVVSVGVDPISKKPLYHFNPGALVLSVAAAGCNFRCQFCDNWMVSQDHEAPGNSFPPEEAIKVAQNAGCQGLSYTYTEPTIFMEYVYDIAKLAKQAGLFNTFVTNGYMTPEAVKTIAPYLNAVTVDFKGNADPDFYRTVMSVPNVEPIYDALKEFKLHGVHIELTNLVIPKTGASSERIRTLAKWIKDYLGPDTPLHMLRFHPEYKMSNIPATSVQEMEHAYLTAKNQGLNYVYIGNITDHPAENTICPNCDTPVIKRCGFEITQWNLTIDMRCPVCGQDIPIKGKLWQNNQRFPYALF